MTCAEIVDIPEVLCSPSSETWAVILAGGEGSGFRPLSRLISGDDRPKQFCPIFTDRSLLTHTRKRIAGMTDADRTLVVVTKAHERYYAPELSDVNPRQVVVQPEDRGTAAAIAYALLRIIGRDPDAVIALFPSDHFISDGIGFRCAVETAIGIATLRPDSLLLLGAQATRPATEYGWIEPGSAPVGDSTSHVYHVNGFWEKPSFETARALQDRGYLWNTSVVVGRACAFFSLLEFTVPGLLRAFSANECCGSELNAHFEDLAPVDFTQQILSRCTAQLLVVRMAADVGWSDLGEPDRVLATLARTGIMSRLPHYARHPGVIAAMA